MTVERGLRWAETDASRPIAGFTGLVEPGSVLEATPECLGMTPLAEGVETKGERDFLRANGCRLAQGFLFSRPVPPSEIAGLVRGRLAHGLG